MAYRAQEDRWLAKLAGGFLVPVAADLASRAAVGAVVDADRVDPRDDRQVRSALSRAIAAIVAVHLASAGATYYVSETAESLDVQAFARGGAWSEVFNTALISVFGIQFADEVARIPAQGARRTLTSARSAEQNRTLLDRARRASFF